MEKTSGAAVAVGSVGKQRSAIRSKKSGFTNVTERVMKYIFTVCAVTAVACVLMITIYMIRSGAPAIGKVGLTDFLFGDTWYAKKEQFGILPLILTSVFGTLGAIVIGVPIGLLTAVFLSELAPKAMKNVVKPAVELLAGIPSVIYGLLGANLVKPLMYALEEVIYANDPTHQFTGGANLASAIIVLAIMILPTIINISENGAELSFDTKARKASVRGEALSLTRKETGILEYLLLHQGRPISQEELLEHVWDSGADGFGNSIRVHISALRKKLRAALGYDPIRNRIGEGYVMEAQT